MGYCTQADLERRYSVRNIASLAARDGTAPADVIAAVIEGATGVIDSYIGSRYALPLAEIPAVLVDIACDIAVYRLYKDVPTETAQARHDAALTMLKDISRGIADLPIPREIDASPEKTRVLAPARVFTDTTLKGFL